MSTRRFLVPLLFLGCLVVAPGVEFTILPYIQNPGTSTMTVMWKSDTLEESTVTIKGDFGDPELATAPKPLIITFHESWNNLDSPKLTWYIYSVKLTGLRPDRKYSYHVKMDKVLME